MKITRRFFIVLTVSSIATAAWAEQRNPTSVNEEPNKLYRRMTPPQYRLFLASLKTDLARWQAQLTQTDVGSLGLDFKSGKVIEDTVSDAKRLADQCQQSQSLVEERQTLGGNVILYSCMEQLGESVYEVGDALMDLSSGESFAKARTWAIELRPLLKEIHEDTLKLFGHVSALADVADSSCSGLARYLR